MDSGEEVGEDKVARLPGGGGTEEGIYGSHTVVKLVLQVGAAHCAVPKRVYQVC